MQFDLNEKKILRRGNENWHKLPITGTCITERTVKGLTYGNGYGYVLNKQLVLVKQLVDEIHMKRLKSKNNPYEEIKK